MTLVWSFYTEIEQARNNLSKPFELRAPTILFRLWSRRGKRPEGRHMLAEVYSRFTKRKNTGDLISAQRRINRPHT